MWFEGKRTNWSLKDSFHSYWAESKENAVTAFFHCYLYCFMVAMKAAIFQEPHYFIDKMLWNTSVIVSVRSRLALLWESCDETQIWLELPFYLKKICTKGPLQVQLCWAAFIQEKWYFGIFKKMGATLNYRRIQSVLLLTVLKDKYEERFLKEP